MQYILVDVSNLAFRSHYVFKGLSHAGKPTGMLYGCLNAVLSLRQAFRMPLVFCWDYGLPGMKTVPSWRRRIFPTYKAERTENPDREAVLNMFPELGRVLRILGIQSVGIPGLEADDIISLLAQRLDAGYVFTTDRDLYQVLEKNAIKIIRPKKQAGKYEIVSRDEVETESGILIDSWATYLALGGDKSDGIHVMRGVGPVGAIKMVQAGIDLTLEWEEQPYTVRTKFKVCEPHWKALQAAYQVAKLPISPFDSRIKHCIPDAAVLEIGATTKPSLEYFTEFCADYGLRDHMARRREFFV
jgi:5'-3' exonuclease